MALLYGDTPRNLSGRSVGVNNDGIDSPALILLNGEGGTAFGDAGGTIRAKAVGGNDLLIGGEDTGSFTANTLYGDASEIAGSGTGGNDTLAGGAGTKTVNHLNGDAETMTQSSLGGTDTLIGGNNASNEMFGDARLMYGSAVGGNDTLTAGDGGTNTMYGDARVMADSTIAGSDTLISGTGVDEMWGDAWDAGAGVTTAADTFVFKPGSGNDFIYDFRQSDHDKIDVSAYGFDAVTFVGQNVTPRTVSTVVDFGGGSSVTLVGLSDRLTAADFIF